jgi:dTDP-4-amino-4,6-dideoxygalactose transaminase
MELADRHELKVIEDCAQSHGARDHNRPVGAIGHIGCFSFCQDKIISTGGEGGMVVTDDEALYKRMWAYRDHGRDYELAHAPHQAAGFQWLTTDFGTNWRMTESQAAIGRKQLAKLPRWLARRRAIAAHLSSAIGGLNAVQLPAPPREAEHAFYKYMFQVDPAALREGWSRDRIMAELEARGIPTRVGGCPDISREQAFRRHGFTTTTLPTAAWLEGRTLMLPVHPTLSDDNVAFMTETLRSVLAASLR